MKHRLKCLLFVLLCATNAYAFDIVKPDAEQEIIKNADIRNLGMNTGVYMGVMNYENFNSSLLLAWYLNYPFDENLFVEAELGISRVSDTEYRNIGLPLLSEERVVAAFYTVLVGYNLLPGEVYLGHGKTLRSDVYLLAGVGTVDIDNNSYVALHFGGGIKIELNDDSGLRIEFRDRMIDSDILGSDKLTNNTEFHLGIDWKF
ncbi:MAG: outer membrane beta-barrel domain-containing protein [Gammaproteobacteria bacterium]|nr:outer membrane beta-barrel domain-containing protein [Gammaproteobacteria bacterium]